MNEPTLSELFRVFGRVGLVSFGGPAAQMALMHRELVEDRAWLNVEEYLRALSFCMLLPGPEAMQLATYAGWRLRGVVGGLISGLLFVVPGSLVILALAMAYGYYGQLPATQSAFLGIKAAVVIILANALLKLARKTLITNTKWLVATGSFLAIYLFDAPFPALILAAAVLGYFAAPAPEPSTRALIQRKSPYLAAAICAVLWVVPVLLLQFTGPTILGDIALFFSKLAVVTFGGAYAVLAYMTQATVGDFGWLSTSEMIDGLGLAETTPGPLILVTEFVGYLAAFKQGGPLLGLAGAAVTLWVTFTPCFLWIFLAAGHVESLTQRPKLANALGFVTAAVVGVILNLGLWFTINVWFTTVRSYDLGMASMVYPEPESISPGALGLTLIAAILLLKFRLSLFFTLPAMAVISALISMPGWG